MREILGRRRKLSLQRKGQTALLNAAVTYAEQWQWRVVPGVGYERRAGRRAAGVQPCACGRPNCPVPGAHPLDPGLLAATRDARMVRFWWTRRPDAPVVLATGDRVSAASLPVVAGTRAVEAMERQGVRLGPVVVTPTRCLLLVAPYSLADLGEILDSHEWVPTSLRYHGDGGYVVLPPSGTTTGQVHWLRPPQPDHYRDGGQAPWLPQIGTLVDALIRAGRSAPDGDRLTY